MKRQAIFNKVYKHLMSQKGKAYNRIKQECRYLDEATGKRCAVGCLIKDRYNPEDLKGNIHDSGSVYEAVKASNKGIDLSHENISMLFDLQTMHDLHHPNGWKKRLATFAEKNGLKIPKKQAA